MKSRHAASRRNFLRAFRPVLVSRAGVLLLSLFAAGSAFAQMVDLNGNGMSDIWEWVYSATNASPSADADGDGVSNLQEAGAGTNPFNSNSVPRISAFVLAGTNGSITMPSQPGKVYQLQSVAYLGATNWLTETSMVVRAGTSFTFPSTAGPTNKFYRIVISDTNTDGGQMNDWEKYQLGLDPSNAWSNATLDGNGNPLTDYQYTVGKLAAQNVITISASDPVTTQPDPGSTATDTGVFTVSRGGFPLNTITVNLAPSGAGAGFGTPGTDFSALPVAVDARGGRQFTEHQRSAAGEHQSGHARRRAIAAAPRHKLFCRQPVERQRGDLPFAHGERAWPHRLLFYERQHHLHKRGKFQSHEFISHAR